MSKRFVTHVNVGLFLTAYFSPPNVLKVNEHFEQQSHGKVSH
jgi:hypothetical protein